MQWSMKTPPRPLLYQKLQAPAHCCAPFSCLPGPQQQVSCTVDFIYFTPTALFPSHNNYLFGCTTLLHIAAHAVMSGFLCRGSCSPGARRCPAC